MSKPTMLEVQLAAHQNNPGYGPNSGTVGLQYYDLDTERYIQPEEIGLAVNAADVTELFVRGGAQFEQVQYPTLAFYGADSPHAQSSNIHGEVTALSTLGGFVQDSWLVPSPDGVGVRFPNIGLQKPDEDITVAMCNEKLRHEIGHLVSARRVPLYGNRTAVGRMRAELLTTAYTAAAIASPFLDVPTVSHLRFVEGYPVEVIRALALGIPALALAAYGAAIAMNSRKVLRALDPGERRADRFAAKHANINPITVL